MYKKHINLPHNKKGHDYIIGDLHGHLDSLTKLLQYIQFNKSVDRLFSTGDTIDRGPNSLESAYLINEDWFFSTLGNHEHMMIQSIINHNPPYTTCWLQNGGTWHLSTNKNELIELSHTWSTQPLIYSIHNNNNRFNILHAEILSINHYHKIIPINNSYIDNWQFSTLEEDNILWGRNIYDIHWHYNTQQPKYIPPKSILQFHLPDLSPTYVGHSFVNIPVQIQQLTFIDTGMSLNYTLTAISPTQQLFFQYSPQTNKFYTSELSNIKQINIPH